MDSQCSAIWTEFEEEVDSVIMAMTAGVTTNSSGVLEWNSNLEEESQSQSEEVAPTSQAFLEVENQRLEAQVASYQIDILILQQKIAEHCSQMGLLKSKMMEYLKTSLDKLKASESVDKELLREELRSAQGKILELETVIDDAHKDAHVKAAELKGKDKLIQDLSSKVESLEQTFEEKSREVDQLKEELAREKRTGEQKRMKMEERIRNKLKDVFFTAADELGNQLGMEVEDIGEEDDSVNPATVNSAPDLATPLLGHEPSPGSGGGTIITQVMASERSTGTGTVDDKELIGGTSSGLPSSDSPPKDYNLSKRNSKKADCSSVSGSNSKRSNRIRRMRVTATLKTSVKVKCKRHAVDPASPLHCTCGKKLSSRHAVKYDIENHTLAKSVNRQPCLICGTKPLLHYSQHSRSARHLRNLRTSPPSQMSTQQPLTMPQEDDEDPRYGECGVIKSGSTRPTK